MIQNSYAVYALEYDKWSRKEDPSKSYFTPDVILDLTKNNYPIKNPEKVQEFYDKWDDYTKFREYYLNTQTERFYEFKEIEYVDRWDDLLVIKH